MTAIDPLLHVVAAGFVVVVLARSVGDKLHDYALYSATLVDYCLLPDFAVPFAAAGLLAAEASAIVLLLIPATSALGTALAILLFALYGSAMAMALLDGRTEIECGCGGEGQLVSWGLVARNAVLAAIAAPLVSPMTARSMGSLDFLFAAVAVVVVCLLLAIAEKTIGNAAAIKRLENQSLN